MTVFSSELSGSLIFNSASTSAAVQPYNGGINISGSELYINEVGLDTRISAVEAGFEGSASLQPLNRHSASVDLFTSSLNTYTGSVDAALAAINSYTQSSNIRIASLESADDSYLTLSTLPTGTVSSSNQIDTLGYITSASAAAIGFGSGTIPAGTLSSSQQISDLGYITSSDSLTNTGSFATTSSNTFTGSQFFSGSLIPEANGSNNGIHDLGSLSQPWKDLYLTTASLKFVRDGALVSTLSGERNAIRIGNILITTASISVVSGSGDSLTTIQNIVQADVSSSGEVNTITQSIAPSGTISSSAQIQAIIDDAYISSSAASSGFGSGGGGGGGNVPSGTVSSSLQISSSAAEQGFSTNYNGDRIVSSTYFPGLTGSVNLGTSGSIQQFLDKLFFPNSAPTFTSDVNQDVVEFATSGSTLLTLAATDAEGQAVTFAVDSGYTDDFIKVSTNGVITLNVIPTEANFNTVDRGDGTLAHSIDIVVTDAFGTSTTRTFYFTVTANSAPVFRQTSVAGSIISSFTSNRNENASSGEVTKIYFTDAESDTITIESSSIPSEFSVVKYGTYVQINQETGSLDYETTPTFQFSITASDEHYQGGEDTSASSSLPITINVTDNVIPVVNDQTLSSINENSSDGTVVGNIAASDDESDTITFRNFTLSKLELDNVDVSTSTYGGTAQLTDPHEDPFQMNSSGQVTRKTGVFLNSDLINEYQYTVEVVDSFNTASDAGTITIGITDDTAASISDNWSAGPYIKESELDGTTIKTTDYGSTQADYNSNQSGTFASSNSSIAIASNGNLSLNVDLSGSLTSSGDVISSTITFTNTFGTTTTASLGVSVVGNAAPTATFTNQTANLNTNLATLNTNLVSVAITDTEGDTPYQLTLGGTDAASFNAVPQNAASSSWQLQASSDLTAGTYNYEVTVTDSFSKNTSYTGRSITVAQADSGTLATNGTYYIIESATAGNNIVLGSNGRTGTQGSVSVSYSPDYGSQAIQSFTSSNALIDVDSSGDLTVGNDISGSGNTDGDTISSTITWRDQYDNIASSSIDINITENTAPDIIFTDTTGNLNSNLARTGNTLTTLTFSDVESDSIQYGDFVGVESAGLNFVQSGITYLVQPTGSLAAGSYTISGSITDNHGFSTNTEAHTFTIAAADTGTLNGDTAVYIIESAESGNAFRDATGFNNGNTGQVGVSYSPSYGSPVVQSYTSSNAAIEIDSSGNLTLGVNLSGSVTQSGDTFNSTITYRDQYNNIGSGTVTATVFGNQSPSANFTAVDGLETNTAVSGSDVGSLTVTDLETDIPFTITLGGTNGSSFDVVGTTTPFEIQPKAALASGTYSIDITITDDYAESVTLSNETITVAQSSDYGRVYVYISTYGSDAGFGANYLGVMGGTTVNSDVPPEVTAYTANTLSPFYRVKSGDIGDASITLAGSTTATLLVTGSGSDLDSVLDGFGTISANTTGQVLVMYPSGSDMTVPTSIQESFNSVAGGAVPAFDVDGNGFSIESGIIHSITLDTAHLGYSEWFVFGRKTRNSVASGLKVRLVAADGSLPT